MKIGVKFLLILTLLAVSVYIGVFISRNIGSDYTIRFSPSDTAAPLNQVPDVWEDVLVDVNSASANQLSLLPQISDSLAESIVSHRERFGNFTSYSQLLDVEGMTKGKLEAIWPYISLGGTYEDSGR